MPGACHREMWVRKTSLTMGFQLPSTGQSDGEYRNSCGHLSRDEWSKENQPGNVLLL